MRIILTTVIALLALAVHAFAADQQQGTVTLTVPGVFHLQYNSGNGNVAFNPTETQILLQGTLDSAIVGVLGATSNYNATKLFVKRSAWTPLGNPSSDGQFNLRMRNHSSMGNTNFILVPQTAGNGTQIGTWPNGVAAATYNVMYRLDGLSTDDDPDTYTSTVTYTLTHT
jgi:hypothetical protein